MLLKSIEIKGFKSFADKTIIHFNEGITGIIGPNGCGKSNIIDSIRWVIGEQKISHLRSDNLESLIFNGSKTRNASALAEVILIFENNKKLLPSEYSEISITRRFYKSGESEYRLNDVICRLKDIQNLFLDTGITSDSYSIIELGMVDDIIKDKENSRRRLLEQAAGITLYKSRKKEAQSKLDQTSTDLNRIEDILFEISGQLKIQENQAQKALKYRDLKKEYKELSIILAKASTTKFQQEYQKIKDELQIQQDKKLAQETKLHLENAGFEDLASKIIEKEKLVQVERQNFGAIATALLELENSKKLLIQQIKFNEDKKSQLILSAQKANQQIEAFDYYLQKANDQLVQQKEDLKNIADQQVFQKNVLIQKKDSYEKLRIELEGLRQSNQNQQKQQFETEKRLATILTSIENNSKNQQNYNLEITQKNQQIDNLNTELLNINQKNTVIETQIQEEIIIQNKTLAECNSVQESIENQRNMIVKTERNLDAKKYEYNWIQEMINKLEGYPEGVKFLSKSNEWSAEAPLLSDILYVQEPYRAAIEYILEPFMNFFVVKNYGEAIKAVQLLKDHKKGKASFLILDSIQHYDNQMIASQNSYLKAIDCIEIEAQYQTLFHYLLNNIYIVENEEAPDNLENHLPIVYVQKNAHWVVGKFQVSGGSVSAFEGKKIGRKKNLEKLAPVIAELQTTHEEQKLALTNLQNQFKQLQQIIQQSKLQGLERSKQENFHLANTAKHKIELLQSQILGIKKQIDLLNESLEKFLEEKTKLDGSISEIQKQYSAENLIFVQKQQAYILAENQYTQANNAINELNLKYEKQFNTVNSINQEILIRTHQNTQIQQQKQDLEGQLIHIQDTEAHDKQALQNLDQILAKKTIQKEKYNQQLNELEQEFNSHKIKQFEFQDYLKSLQKERERIELDLNTLKEALNDYRLKLAGVNERLKVEFNIDLESILNMNDVVQEVEDVQALQDKVDKIKRRLENLGEVNPTAVESYNEMKIRHDFITSQRDDLNSARDSLLKTIQEVEETANNQFLKIYTEVRQHFQEVFKTLFTEEDTADLILTDPHNLAETNIEIVAKPKGKRPSSITQLSGGEKTLTATALLFSIYLIKPAPFCIFDEVDAPLDDVNVEKFNALIRKFSKNSQFIIVTHNKQTMNNVDIIYGVTMQEMGVSKIVPVDFRSLKD